MPDTSRSYEPITREDLQRLRDIEAANRREFFARKPKCGALSERVICVALCQGAAKHYVHCTNGVDVDERNGIKDFDVWTFYAALPNAEFPWRWRVERDFGDPKFGQTLDRLDFVGRKVDLLGRSLEVQPTDDPVIVLRQYLCEAHTSSARHLAMKAVVLLEPEQHLGTLVWPVDTKK